MMPEVSRNAAGRERLMRVLPTLATIVVVTIGVLAGNWQRDRLAQKVALGEQVAAAAKMAPVPLPRDVQSWPAWRFRNVEVVGRYDATRQILLDNRVHGGRVGYHVVTPLRMPDGRNLLVNRGFVAAGPTRAVLPDAPPPEGQVTVRGRVNMPARFLELGEPEKQRVVWQNLHPERYAQAMGIDVLPIVVEALGGPPDGLVRDWPPPNVDTGPHRAYMLQWYTFAALALGLWLWFTLRRLRRR
jgi:surfeit locus 1 family protein